jgi:hypothetical protein
MAAGHVNASAPMDKAVKLDVGRRHHADRWPLRRLSEWPDGGCLARSSAATARRVVRELA